MIEVINNWDGRLTWKNVQKIAKRETGRNYVRQTLYNNGSVRAAYQAHQEMRRLDYERSDRKRKAGGTEEIVRKLRQQILQLRKENNLLMERFARWVYNASARGLDEEFLDNPLPSIDRRHR